MSIAFDKKDYKPENWSDDDLSSSSDEAETYRSSESEWSAGEVCYVYERLQDYCKTSGVFLLDRCAVQDLATFLMGEG